MQKNILITGKPKSGKSTLLRKIINDISNKVGFVTNEMLDQGKRVGFEIETNFGSRTVLSHVGFHTSHKVSKLFVDIKNLDSIIPEVSTFKSDDLLCLDEIGEMQLFSDKFKDLVLSYINSDNNFISVISSVYDDDFIRALKQRDEITLVELSLENRTEVEQFIVQLLKKIII